MADVNRASLRGGVLLGGVSIGALLLTLFVARRFIGRPTRTLLAAARRWRDGDLGTPVPGEDPRSEFGQLAAAYNDMAAALARREDDLRGHADVAGGSRGRAHAGAAGHQQSPAGGDRGTAEHRGGAGAVAEAAGGRPACRRHRARLQQSAGDDPGQSRPSGADRAAQGGASAYMDRARHGRGQSRLATDRPAAGVLASAAAGGPGVRREQADVRPGAAAAHLHTRPAHPHRYLAGRGSLAGDGGAEPGGSGDPQPRAERA